MKSVATIQVEMHIVEVSVQVFLRDGLILYRNIGVIKYLAPILLSLAILHSKNVLKGGICWWEALQFG